MVAPRPSPCSPRTRACLGLLLGVLLGSLPFAGCRHVPLGALLVRGGSEGLVEAGDYADDERVTTLIATWGERVARAQDRVVLVTGLALEEVEGEAVLRPLGDETRAYDARIVLRRGRRQPLLAVNLERLASGAESADAVLARGLTLGVLEVASLRGGGALPPWTLALAGSAAAGDLAQRLERMVRDDVLAGREVGARVDPQSPAVAESTGLAALLLLLDRGGPDLVRALLAGLADGDPAEPLLQRLSREHASPWPAARAALELRLAQQDLGPFRLLREAEATWKETGRAGLLALLPATLPAEVEEELRVLIARAAFAEGDLDAARATLALLPPDAASRLRDPLAAAELRIRAEAAPGGDQALAQVLAEQLERDHPRSGAIDRLRDEARLPERPERALAALERRAQGAGLEALELDAVRRLLDLLTRAQRFGAAQRVLDRLGERAGAPELADLSAWVAREQREPSEAAIVQAEAAVKAWLEAPEDVGRQARVADHGAAAAQALVAHLEAGDVRPRAAGVALLASCVGPEAVVRLAPAWQREPGRLEADLEALATRARVPELEVWTRTHADAALAGRDVDALFEALRLDLDAEWVLKEPDVPTELRSPDYARRRAAFERTLEAGEALRAPRLVARLLADPSPLLRRDAARLAGEAGFEALARAALDDAAAPVRRAAAFALGRSSEPASLARLLQALAQDDSPWVRAAAAHAAEQAAPARPQVVDGLLRALADPHPFVGQAARAALDEVPPRSVAAPALAMAERELGRKEPRSSVLKALFVLLEPAYGAPLGYDPAMPTADVRRLLARVRERLTAPPVPRR
jgi:hypothetical protein